MLNIELTFCSFKEQQDISTVFEKIELNFC